MTACNRVVVPENTPTPAPPTTVPATPTATPPPPAFSINGTAISQAEYDAQLVQVEEALKEIGESKTSAEKKQLIIQELTDQVLLAQAAEKDGYLVTEEIYTAFLKKLTDGGAKLDTWKAANGYTDEGFEEAIRRLIAATWERDKIIETVPAAMEQIRAQQILVNDLATAQRVLTRLKNGETFDALAQRYDPVKAGMLGWFPRGYLTQPKVEEAAFSLQPGEYSEPIETDFGYHIIYVLDRKADRPLDTDAKLTLQSQVLDSWLTEARKSVVITEP